MKLEDFAEGGSSLPFAVIGGDITLSRQIQQRLADIGLLDPPVDGNFGPVSQWALGQFVRKVGTSAKSRLDSELARALLADSATTLFPLNTQPTLAGRIVGAMQAAGHWLNRHPDCVNIVYVEGIDADGQSNGNPPNEFNDLRLLLRVNRAGNPDIVGSWEGTSEPGRLHTVIQKFDPRGAARIAFGQYKAWSVGTHKLGRPSAHEALVQTLPIPVHRDLNQDFQRTGDKVFVGLFGINQHWGFDLPRADIGNASAGCLLGRTKTGHRQFMQSCKTDPRFVASQGYRFMTAVIPADAVNGA